MGQVSILNSKNENKKENTGQVSINTTNTQESKKLSKVYLTLKLINVQGLTQAKAIELESLTNGNYITLLTETQQKFSKVRYNENTINVEQMRGVKDKKGGGLAILTKNKNIKMKKIDTKQKDILLVEINYGMDNFTIILFCLSPKKIFLVSRYLL